MLYLEFNGEEKGHCLALEKPVFLRRERNGVLLRCDRQAPAQGVLSPDEREVWQLEGRPSLGDGYPTVRIITLAEYEEWLSLGNQDEYIPETDPEDLEPVVPDDVEPEMVLTRAELTAKVTELDEALQMLLSGVTEDG